MSDIFGHIVSEIFDRVHELWWIDNFVVTVYIFFLLVF